MVVLAIDRRETYRFLNSAIDSSVTRKAFGVGLALSHSNSTNRRIDPVLHSSRRAASAMVLVSPFARARSSCAKRWNCLYRAISTHPDIRNRYEPGTHPSLRNSAAKLAAGEVMPQPPGRYVPSSRRVVRDEGRFNSQLSDYSWITDNSEGIHLDEKRPTLTCDARVPSALSCRLADNPSNSITSEWPTIVPL